MKRTLQVVFDDISEWSNSYGTFYGVGGMFDDGSILQANKKTRHDAQALREILLQIIDIECDYYCDDKGLSQKGNQKWALKAILDAEGGPIYGSAPGVDGVAPKGKPPAGPVGDSGSIPDTSTSDPRRSKEEMRATEALKAAVAARPGGSLIDIEHAANYFDGWLKSKSSATVESSVVPPFSTPPVADSSSPAARQEPVETAAATAGDTPSRFEQRKEQRLENADVRAGYEETSGGSDREGPDSSDPSKAAHAAIRGDDGDYTSGGSGLGEGPAPTGSKYTGSPPPGWVTEGQ